MQTNRAETDAKPAMNGVAHRKIGHGSRLLTLGTVNGRSIEGKFIRQYQAELFAHIGGAPSVVQRRIIERCSQLALHLTLMDRRAAAEGGLSPHAGREYLAWNNALIRSLRNLGIKGIAERPPSLADYAAAKAARAAGQTTSGAT